MSYEDIEAIVEDEGSTVILSFSHSSSAKAYKDYITNKIRAGSLKAEVATAVSSSLELKLTLPKTIICREAHLHGGVVLTFSDRREFEKWKSESILFVEKGPESKLEPKFEADDGKEYGGYLWLRQSWETSELLKALSASRPSEGGSWREADFPYSTVGNWREADIAHSTGGDSSMLYVQVGGTTFYR